MSQQADYASVIEENAALKSERDALKRQLAWFKKQVFGEKSERRLLENDPDQLPLSGLVGEAVKSVPVEKETITYERGKAKKKRGDDCVTDIGLRFDDTVPVEVIEVQAPELAGPDADQYEVITTKSLHRLAQRPASLVVLRYDMPVVKRKGSNDIITTPAPAGVFDQSLADVSFLVGMLIDKFMYHMPLYRQHQRLAHAGITLSRATLTHLGKRSIELLRPIVEAQLRGILRSKVLAMDETPIKAGRSGKGKMKTGWFWPVYGDQDEMVFTYANTRAKSHIEKVLASHFEGTLISDGYVAYARYTEANEHVVHAQCWVHSRRQFIEAEDVEPGLVAIALQYIRELHAVETQIKECDLSDDQKRAYRLDHSKPVVDAFFAWCEQQLTDASLLPDNPLIKAVGYVLKRQTELRVFLEDPAVPLDTNHLERGLRPIPMGRRNWLFAWTELGAEHVGIIQSLICTCRLQGVDPYTYLVDVLQRISIHPAHDVESLTPRLWKQKYAEHPMRSDLYRDCQ
jgi:transposase|tara:strand:+ start:203 stop:1747 length:1545 start_codon:yes stop_codon:yes gene_type:complete